MTKYRTLHSTVLDVVRGQSPLAEAGTFSVAKDLKDYAKRQGGVDKVDFLRVSTAIEKNDPQKVGELLRGMDTDPVDLVMDMLKDDDPKFAKKVEKSMDEDIEVTEVGSIDEAFDLFFSEDDDKNKKKGKKNPDKVRDKIDTDPKTDDDKGYVGEITDPTLTLKKGQKLKINSMMIKKKHPDLKKHGGKVGEVLDWDGTKETVTLKVGGDTITVDADVALEKVKESNDMELDERELTDAEEKKKEEIVKELKKKKDEFEEKYGDKAMDVIYATATKMAKNQAESVNEDTVRSKKKPEKKYPRHSALSKKKPASKKEVKEAKVTYDDVFNAVAKHMGLKPDEIDKADKETKKKFFNTIDKCWDSKSDTVPDACPVNIGTNEEREQKLGNPRFGYKKRSVKKKPRPYKTRKSRPGPMGGHD